ncbi:MAG TPA: FBP domain-containing protein [Streptomyces sp.]|nr:FBP domain-containing protein [Streptomyces sp.]
MEHITEPEIRASFVNCSKGEARRINLPKDLAELPWEHLDFLGWRDPGAADRGYLVIGRQDGLVGLTLRAAPGGRRSLLRTSLCSFCVTSHSGSGVDLLSARKAGPAGRNGDTLGIYVCADLACSLYVRGRKKNALAKRLEESLTLEEQIARTVGNVHGFVDQIVA